MTTPNQYSEVVGPLTPQHRRAISADGSGGEVGAEKFGPRIGNFLRPGRTEMAVIIAIKLGNVRIYTAFDSLPCIWKCQLGAHYRVIR